MINFINYSLFLYTASFYYGTAAAECNHRADTANEDDRSGVGSLSVPEDAEVNLFG